MIDDIRINVDAEISKNFVTIILIPLTPPKTILFGKMNKLNDTAQINNPKSKVKYLLTLCFL